MTSTFDKVADIIAETSEIDRETITPKSHTIDDLGIDSLEWMTLALDLEAKQRDDIFMSALRIL